MRRGPRLEPITLTTEENNRLMEWTRRHKTSQALALRARIVLACPVPAKVQVIRHVRPKYACACCHSGVKIAPVPVQILPRTNAAPGLLAHLITAKYVDSLPLHRQETIFARHGIALPRATQAAWIIAVAQQLQPLVNLMDERLGLQAISASMRPRCRC